MKELPQQIGSITILREVERSGSMVTCHGALAGGERQVRVRCIPAHVASSLQPPIEPRVKDLAGVRHPFLAPMLELVQHDDWHLVLEELPEGVSVSEIVRRCREKGSSIPANVFLNLATQVCNGLEALHGRPGKGSASPNVLHLAMRPEALVVGRDGKVQLTFYGLDFSSELTGGGHEYLSPEQTRGEQKLLPASDIFSLATILYEMCTLEPLFKGATQDESVEMVRRGEVTTQLLRVKEIMPGLDKILYRALSLSPRHRYQRAFVLREDLRGLMAGYSFASIANDTRVFLLPFLAPTAPPPRAGALEAQDAPGPLDAFDEHASTRIDPDPVSAAQARAPAPEPPAQEPQDQQQVDDQVTSDHPVPGGVEVDPSSTMGFIAAARKDAARKIGPAAEPPAPAAPPIPDDPPTVTASSPAPARHDEPEPPTVVSAPPVAQDEPAAALPEPSIPAAQPPGIFGAPQADRSGGGLAGRNLPPPIPRSRPAEPPGPQEPPPLPDLAPPVRSEPPPSPEPPPPPISDLGDPEDDTGDFVAPRRKTLAVPLVLGAAGLVIVAAAGFWGALTLLRGMSSDDPVLSTEPVTEAVATLPAPAGEPPEEPEEALASAESAGEEPGPQEPPVREPLAGAATPRSGATAAATAPAPRATSREPERAARGSSSSPYQASSSAQRRSSAGTTASRVATPPVRQAEPERQPAMADVYISEDDGVALLEDPDPSHRHTDTFTLLDRYSAAAAAGGLTSSDLMVIEMVEPMDPAFNRSRFLLLMNARARSDLSATRRYLDELSARPENQYNPVVLAEYAVYYVNKGDYDRALEKAMLAERHWARLPPEQVFTKKAQIFEVEAAAFQGMFYRSEDNVELLDKAVRHWQKYREHVNARARSDLAAKADQEIEKLERTRQRLR